MDRNHSTSLSLQQGASTNQSQCVMIIGHNQALKGILRYALGTYGFDTVSCETCDDALLNPSIRAVDYIVADIDQPDSYSDASGKIRRLRERFHHAILIGMSRKDRSVEILHAGANDFLLIPFIPYYLVTILSNQNVLERV